ncbi:MAG TPA: hypothetical protein VN201_01345, partial [Roseateles sp.]|nr:hypothetical protein [Roseateles sp.]
MAFIARYHSTFERGTQAWREQAGVIVWYAELAGGLAIKTLKRVAQCRWVAGSGMSLPSLLLTRAENVRLSAKFIRRSKIGLLGGLVGRHAMAFAQP